MKKQEGFLIIVALVMILIFGLLSAALVRMFISTTSSTTNVQAAAKSWPLAWSAVEKGLYQLNQSPAVCNGASQGINTVTTGDYQFTCTSYQAISTLASGLSASGTTVTLTSASSFASSGSIRIDDEIIYYGNKTNNNLTGLRRGKNNTIASSHLTGAQIYQNEYLVAGQSGVASIGNPQGTGASGQAMEYIQFFAGDANGSMYTFNGQTWSKTLDSTTQSIYTILCPDSINCMAAGGNSAGTFYGYNTLYNPKGAVWSQIAVFSNTVYQIFCISTSICVGVDSGGNVISTTNGISWVAKNFPKKGFAIYGVACISASNCFAVGDNAYFYEFDINGNSRSQTQPNAFGNKEKMMSIACGSVGNCEAVGSSGKFYDYNVASNKWTPANNFGSSYTINKIVCINASNCKAVGSVGSSGAFFTYNGSNWSLSSAPANSSGVNDITCVDANRCYAVGDGGKFYYFNGTSWSINSTVGTASIQSISNIISPAITLTTNY